MFLQWWICSSLSPVNPKSAKILSDINLAKPLSDFEKQIMSRGTFSLVGRVVFLQLTQQLNPKFWRRLNTLWRGGIPDPVTQWSTDVRVSDEWLIKAGRQTVAKWAEDPRGPMAELHPTHLWFFYDEEAYAPDFAPTFERPYPTYSSSSKLSPDQLAKMSKEQQRELEADVKLESLDDFEARIRKEFDSKLRSYRRFIESVWNYERSPQLGMHAAWAVYAFAGMPIAQLARDFDPRINGVPSNPNKHKRPDESFLESRHGVKDPDAAIRKGIKRFCEATWITLPKGKPKAE
jgi:hypothetical protein